MEKQHTACPSCDDELFEVAINMAEQAFRPVTDEHVNGVYERLKWNADHGLGQYGAVTVH